MESCRIGSCRFLLGFLYFRNIHSLISKNRDLYHSWSWWVYIFLSEHFCAWSPLLAGPPSLSSQRSARIPIFEPLTSQGNMIQGANLKCVANTPGYPGTGPSFQVIPQSKTDSILILQVKFRPLPEMFFPPLILLPNTFPASGSYCGVQNITGATKPSSLQFPDRAE